MLTKDPDISIYIKEIWEAKKNGCVGVCMQTPTDEIIKQLTDFGYKLIITGEITEVKL